MKNVKLALAVAALFALPFSAQATAPKKKQVTSNKHASTSAMNKAAQKKGEHGMERGTDTDLHKTTGEHGMERGTDTEMHR